MFGERPFGNETSGAIPEVTIVMPCLNEADTLATCIDKAHRAFRETGIDGEVVIADNGSTDGSPDIARGARRARCPGCRARIWQRADGRHRCRARPLRDHGRRRRQLRFPRGAEVRRRAAPAVTRWCRAAASRAAAARCCPARCRRLHRWFGNPALSLLARWWFRTPVHDINCGMRGVRDRRLSTSRPALHGHGVRDRDDHQGAASTGATSPRCRSRCIRTGARPIRRICARFATAGGRCACSSCSRRAGSSSCPVRCSSCSGWSVTPSPFQACASAPRRSTCTRCSSRAWPCWLDSRPSRSRSLPRHLRSARGCCRRTVAPSGFSEIATLERGLLLGACDDGDRLRASGGRRHRVVECRLRAARLPRVPCAWRFPAPR